MRRIADDQQYAIPPTIDDPKILEEITDALHRVGYAEFAHLGLSGLRAPRRSPQLKPGTGRKFDARDSPLLPKVRNSRKFGLEGDGALRMQAHTV